jgi:hypothetical protein
LICSIWQRAKIDKIAIELGFKDGTIDKAELAAIHKKYQKMIEEVKEWNKEW